MRDAWDALIHDFVRHLRGTNRAKSTQRIYQRAAAGLVAFLEQPDQLPPPSGLTRRHVEAYMTHLIETRSASTANVVYRALQQLMKWLTDEEEIDRSPMERMKSPIVPEKPVPVLIETQLRTLLAEAGGNAFVDRRDNAIMRLLDTGGRLSEVAGLRVPDIHFENDVAHVIGKGRRPRALPFGQQTGLALVRYIQARTRENLSDRPELWLVEKNRGPLSSGGVSQMLVRRGDDAGILGLHATSFVTPQPMSGSPTKAAKPTSCASWGGSSPRCSVATARRWPINGPGKHTAGTDWATHGRELDLRCVWIWVRRSDAKDELLGTLASSI